MAQRVKLTFCMFWNGDITMRKLQSLQFFDTVGWAAGRASGL